MFKIKQTKKSTTTLVSLNGQNKVNEKRMQLNQNNDFINIHSHQYLPQSQQSLTASHSNPLKNTLLRPRSGLNRNIQKTTSIKHDELSDQQLIQQKIKQKAINKLLRPSTSTNINENSNAHIDKKHRLMNRKGTINNSNNLPPKSMKVIANQNIDCQNYQNLIMNGNKTNGYITNQLALQIITKIIDQQQQYVRLREINQQQFERIRKKLISNVSIIVLKWSKILQDKIISQVKTTVIQTNHKNNNNIYSTQQAQRQQQKTPQTLQQLISLQIKRHFHKCDGLFTVQQKCNNQQSRLQQLINGRLSQLQTLLTVSMSKK